MAAPGSVWGYWKQVQEVSPRGIEDEVAAQFKLALVGSPDERAVLRGLLLGDRVTDIEKEDAAAHLRELDHAPDTDTAAGFSFVLYAAAPGAAIGVRGANGVPIVGDIHEIILGMLSLRPDLLLSLARRLPAFRVPACNRLIQQTSKVNASLAIMSALPGVLPITAIFLPVISVADIVLLTKNQVMMVMRLAAAYGQKPAYTRQTRELLGTVGTALGWRKVAMELTGLVPAGVGLALKATIAYSGTTAVGKAAVLFYQTGKAPDAETIRDAYNAAEGEAEDAIIEQSL